MPFCSGLTRMCFGPLTRRSTMSKLTLGEIPYGIQIDLKKRGVEAATFLVKNQAFILSRDGADYLKSSVKLSVQTPLTQIYQRVAESDKLRMFTMFDLTSCTESIPSVLTLDELSIDGKYISKSMPQAYQNVWINLSPILAKSRDAYNISLQITDVVKLANLVGRGILCMSYNDSDEWLTPNLNVQMIEAYSLLFAMHLKNRFDLSLEEYALIRTLFAAYYAQMVQSPIAPKEIPPILYRCKELYRDAGTARAIDERMEQVSEARNKVAPDGTLNISVICKILPQCGPARIQKLLSERLLYSFMARSPVDSQTMFCAIDYPPYFVYLLLANLRNGKNPLFNLLIKFGNMKAKFNAFADELVSSKMFIDKVLR